MLHRIHIGLLKPVFQQVEEIVFAKRHTVKLLGAYTEMFEIERNLITHVPFEVIPIAAFKALAPLAEDECVHLPGKKVRKSKAVNE